MGARTRHQHPLGPAQGLPLRRHGPRPACRRPRRPPTPQPKQGRRKPAALPAVRLGRSVGSFGRAGHERVRRPRRGPDNIYRLGSHQRRDRECCFPGGFDDRPDQFGRCALGGLGPAVQRLHFGEWFLCLCRGLPAGWDHRGITHSDAHRRSRRSGSRNQRGRQYLGLQRNLVQPKIGRRLDPGHSGDRRSPASQGPHSRIRRRNGMGSTDRRGRVEAAIVEGGPPADTGCTSVEFFNRASVHPGCRPRGRRRRQPTGAPTSSCTTLAEPRGSTKSRCCAETRRIPNLSP